MLQPYGLGAWLGADKKDIHRLGYVIWESRTSKERGGGMLFGESALFQVFTDIFAAIIFFKIFSGFLGINKNLLKNYLYLEHPQKANLSYRQYCRTCLGICSKNAKNRALI
ncbi:MAG: hypothetical protein Q3M24_18945 [Candidatus Electrothrix aestuarii]|uniref:Uncharacterized protein n=1 Tax=Candidatus Electrothrix aestuarii TaxID=3062594 RepID=A0AAU8M321_9BACT